jgi:hypothetical protein
MRVTFARDWCNGHLAAEPFAWRDVVPSRSIPLLVRRCPLSVPVRRPFSIGVWRWGGNKSGSTGPSDRVSPRWLRPYARRGRGHGCSIPRRWVWVSCCVRCPTPHARRRRRHPPLRSSPPDTRHCSTALGAAALRFGRLFGLGELIDTVLDGRSFRSKLASSRRCAARVKGRAARRYGRPQW